MNQLLIAIAVNWIGMYLLCSVYALWLAKVSKDTVFEGWIWWRGFVPFARWRLVSKKSWFAKLWDGFYGHGLLGHMIHKDAPGKLDDLVVEETIMVSIIPLKRTT